MAVDVVKNTYAVKAFLKTGKILDLTAAILELSWQDPAEEIAARATVRIAQTQTSEGNLISQLPLCTTIVIYGNKKEVFRGIIWEWEYESDAQNRAVTLTCYDHFIYAKNSDFYAYYPAGKSTKDVIADICTKNGLKLDYQYESIIHSKLKYDPAPVSDLIKKTLDEAKRKINAQPVALFDQQVLIIRPKGKNPIIYTFETKKNAISTRERLTLDGLITKVIVLGKENKAGRRAIEATIVGDTQFGTLQRYIYRDGNDTLDISTQEAQKMIDDHGKPERLITMSAPDVPSIRKGDKIKASAGSLSGAYFIKGITHNAITRIMTMELERAV